MGYIALYGIAVQTGVVMVVYLHEALDERIASRGRLTARDVWDATVSGSVLRLRPNLMTVAPRWPRCCSETGPLLGAVVSKGLTPRLTIEGQAAWLDGGPGMNGATAMGSLLVNLIEPDRPVVPFVALGGGIYHATFDMGRLGMFGHDGWRDGPGMMGSMWYGPGAMVGTGPLPWPDHVPQFYARRLGGVTPRLDGRWHMRSFTDPMVVLGGGMRIDVGQRFSSARTHVRW